MVKAFDFWEDLIFVGKRGSDNKSWNEDHFFVDDLYEAFENRIIDKVRGIDQVQPKAVPEEQCNHAVGLGRFLGDPNPKSQKCLIFGNTKQDFFFLNKFQYCPKCGEKL